jgi:hypothetical protein
MIKSVIIAGIFSYPDGVAASSRMRNLALGFAQNGVAVKVISLHQGSVITKYGEQVDRIDGFDIPYSTITQFSKETSNVFVRISNRIKFHSSLNKLVKSITESANGTSDELIFLYGRSFTFLSKILKSKNKLNLKSKFVFDIVEPPRTKTSKIEYLFHPFVWDSSLIFKFKFLKKFDACTFISYSLKDAYINQVQRAIIVPSIVHFSAVEEPNMMVEVSLKIGYVGALLEKDFPALLYKVGEQLELAGMNFELSILGRFENFAIGRAWKIKFDNSIFSTKIKYFSNPSDEEIKSILKQVNFLVLFRKPEFLQQFTFPTRIVEMLAEKKPIIINGFGDFKRYFKNGHNSICIDENEVSKIDSMLTDFLQVNKYNEVLSNGLKLLNTEFNPKINAAKILKAVC